MLVCKLCRSCSWYNWKKLLHYLETVDQITLFFWKKVLDVFVSCLQSYQNLVPKVLCKFIAIMHFVKDRFFHQILLVRLPLKKIQFRIITYPALLILLKTLSCIQWMLIIKIHWLFNYFLANIMYLNNCRVCLMFQYRSYYIQIN